MRSAAATQLTAANRWEFRAKEAEWAKAVLSGDEVKVSVKYVYGGSSGVPDRIAVDTWINGVHQPPRQFLNTMGE